VLFFMFQVRSSETEGGTSENRYSRRNFLAAGLACRPPSGFGTSSPLRPPGSSAAAPASGKITYRVMGKTGMKVSTVGYGCMITSDPTVITRAVDMGINYFDTSAATKAARTSAWWAPRWSQRKTSSFFQVRSEDRCR